MGYAVYPALDIPETVSAGSSGGTPECQMQQPCCEGFNLEGCVHLEDATEQLLYKIICTLLWICVSHLFFLLRQEINSTNSSYFQESVIG